LLLRNHVFSSKYASDVIPLHGTPLQSRLLETIRFVRLLAKLTTNHCIYEQQHNTKLITNW